MAFTVNQVRQFYVASKPAEGDLVVKHENTAEVTDKLKNNEKKGAIKAHVNKDKDHLYFEYMTPKGKVRSDLINLSKIDYIKHTKAEELRNPIRQYVVRPVSYLHSKGLHITVVLKSLLSLDETQELFAAAFRYQEDANASTAMAHVALDLIRALNKVAPGTVKVSLETGGTPPPVVGTPTLGTEVPLDENTKIEDLTATYTGIILTELKQPLNRRGMQNLGVDFDVNVNSQDLGVQEVFVYKMPEDRKKNGFPSGHKIAAMEYYYHGARGYEYRNNGYMTSFPTEYVYSLCDEEKEYDVLDIHYHFSDQGVSSYHSEKDITIAATPEMIEEIIEAIKGQAKEKGVVIEEC